jgi:hypothetical protein
LKRLFLLVLLLAACGPVGDDAAYADLLLPLPVGAQWDYRVVNADGSVSARSERVVSEELADGRRFVVVETTQDGTVTRSRISSLAPLVLVVEREVVASGALSTAVQLDPGEPRGPRSAQLRTGARFDASWTTLPPGGDAAETWTVEDTRDAVDVDAGRFVAVRVRRTRSGAPDSVFWFAPGVGLVRCDGETREALIGYSLP